MVVLAIHNADNYHDESDGDDDVEVDDKEPFELLTYIWIAGSSAVFLISFYYRRECRDCLTLHA